MVGPRSLLAVASALLLVPSVAATGDGGPVDVEGCLPGLTVETGPGTSSLDWPDVEGVYYYNASAVKLDLDPPRLWDAEAGFNVSHHTFAQQPGNYSYMVQAFDTEHRVLATFCRVEAQVPPGAEVPFFGTGWALSLALVAVAVAGLVLVRRRA